MAIVVTVNKLEAARLTAPAGVVPISHSFEALATGIGAGVTYAAGDALGEKFTLAGLVPQDLIGRATLWIQTILLCDRDLQGKMVDLWLADQDFTAAADGDPFSISDAQLQMSVGFLQLATAAADYIPAGASGSVRTVRSLALANRPRSSALYGQLVAREAVTYTAGLDLRIFGFLG